MAAVTSAITLQQVTKAFPLGQGRQLRALELPALAIPAGSYTVLSGPSGSGKTTLLHLIAGLTLPTSGRITVQGTEISALPEAQRDRFRAATMGYIFQTFNLLAAFSALDNVLLAMRFARAVPRQAQRQRATELLAGLGLQTRLAHRPAQLSRGEQQRVAMARALANDPPILLADEPCASLDPGSARAALQALQDLCRERHTTVLLVAHDTAARSGADTVLDMRQLNRAAGLVAEGGVA
jgi:putative ABC transport system ATP-binding protein